LKSGEKTEKVIVLIGDNVIGISGVGLALL